MPVSCGESAAPMAREADRLQHCAVTAKISVLPGDVDGLARRDKRERSHAVPLSRPAVN